MATADIVAAVLAALEAQGLLTRKKDDDTGVEETAVRSLEEKYFRRVEKFSGEEKDYLNWAFDMKICARSVSKVVAQAMETAEKELKEHVFGFKLEEVEPVKFNGMGARAPELYDVICQLTTDKAKLMIMDVPYGDGFRAWQILHKEHTRKTLAKTLRMYSAGVNPEQVGAVEDLVKKMVEWERKVNELQKAENVTIPEMIKLAALTEMCADDIRDLIYQHVEVGAT